MCLAKQLLYGWATYLRAKTLLRKKTRICALVSKGCLHDGVGRVAVERGAQRLGNLYRLSILQHNDGHRSFNRQLFTVIENLVVVTDGTSSQLPHGKSESEPRVEHQHAKETAFKVYAREIVMLAPDIHGPFESAQQFALSLLDNLEDAREVQTPRCVGISPTKTALEFYGSRHTRLSFRRRTNQPQIHTDRKTTQSPQSLIRAYLCSSVAAFPVEA